MTEQMQRERPRQRRRGEELEAALLEAAWEELVSAGFARLTMESVAARAKTGVAVLYRRWPRKDDLVLDAIQHYGATHPVEIPDTGSLRGDMIGLLSGFSSGRVASPRSSAPPFPACLPAPASHRPRSARSSSTTARYGPRRSSAGRTSAARSTSTRPPAPS